ncbi:unnamed protein product [Rotaria magnacalcarata]|uniref:C3H1-type domain-containing protein n=1 Tax=Rotaria magnacalcarata TaxID=392030 RepID=A0A816VZ79_9BILA|nr:unnamed protein product [Rotaria magnacalcarata]CAF2126965.1 unnamed protein product [Rotaria magnacalcarata]CAF4095425.1 unnamed protein product [Rotaria magnacalcarata]CAF4211776.1 unnamed protein product [Rotaria magnacalcarata]
MYSSCYIQNMITSMAIDKCPLSNISTTKIYSKVVGGPVLQTNPQPVPTTTTTDNNSRTTSQRYKTELCRSYQETGLCKYGEKCQFAHGYNEVRSLNRHPKYKTILCRTYHCTGYCPYGPRCHFLHDEYSDNLPVNSISSSSISPSSSFGSDIRSSVSSSRSISPMDSPIINSDDYLFLPSFLLNKLE